MTTIVCFISFLFAGLASFIDKKADDYMDKFLKEENYGLQIIA